MNQAKQSTGLFVVKIGGSTYGNHDTTLEDLVTLQQRGQHPVVVHGGGNAISEWLERLSVPVRFVRGLRVTDAGTLQVVVGVLAGMVNKELVAGIEVLGGMAVGLSGVDGGLLQAEVKEPSLGYVGEVVQVDTGIIHTLVEARCIPVIAPLGLHKSKKKGENGYLLNLNADTVAGDIAAAIRAEKLIFLTDVAGIRSNIGEVIKRLSREEAKGLLTSGVASGGMIPKVEAALRALATVPVTRIIDGRVQHALLREMEGAGVGTTIGDR